MLRKKLQEIDSRRLIEVKYLFERVEKSTGKDAESSDQQLETNELVSSLYPNSSKSIHTVEETEQVIADKSNNPAQHTVSKSTSDTSSKSPLHETLQIVAAATAMASIVSQNEGVE